MILVAAIAMTTLGAQANETMDAVSNAVEKAVDAVTPSATVDDKKASEVKDEAKAKAEAEENKTESENK